MRRLLLGALVLLAPAVHAADRIVIMKQLLPIAKNVPAMPEIAEPQDAAEQAINTAVARIDMKLRASMKDCTLDNGRRGDWKRTVQVTQAGPGFLSYVMTDDADCGGPHPSVGMTSIVYDLKTGRPVDWTKLLPASLTGTVALDGGFDGQKYVTLQSKQLYALYLAGYPRKHEKADPGQQTCFQMLQDAAADGGSMMWVWLDAKGDGVGFSPDVAYVINGCADPVVLSTESLRKLGANAAMLDAIDAAHRAAPAKN